MQPIVEQQGFWPQLLSAFRQAMSKTTMKPADVCRALLASTRPNRPDAIDVDSCRIEPQGEYVRVTFSTPIPDVPASLRTYKYRNPNNHAIVDDQGRWTGVVAYFREWQDFIEAAREYIYTTRVHQANL